MSPSKAKGTNLTNHREGTVGNRREVRGEGLLLEDVTATVEGFRDLEEAEVRGGGGGRKVGVLSTVAIGKAQRERER